MSLASIIRASGVANIYKITKDGNLHVTVTHKVWKGQTFDGDPDFASVTRTAIVERKQKLVRTMSGTEEMSSSSLIFPEQIPPTTPNAGYARTNPVDVNDMFTLPDGTTAPVLAVEGIFDGETNAPYYSQVYLG